MFDGLKSAHRSDQWPGTGPAGSGPGLGLKSCLRAGPGPKFQARAGP